MSLVGDAAGVFMDESHSERRRVSMGGREREGGSNERKKEGGR